MNSKAKNVEENKRYKWAKTIAKGYLIGALSISFSHFIHAFNKMGLYGFGAMSMPIAVDGLAIFGVLLQHKDFSEETRTIGRWMQLICGSLSLAVNVYSGWGSPGAVIQGATWVTIYMVLELIVARIRLASADKAAADAEAAAKLEAEMAASTAWMIACSHPTRCSSEAQCSTKKVARAKAQKTIKAKAKTRAIQAQALQSLLDTPVVEDSRVSVIRAA
jgi:hypothetical protein